MPGLALHLLGPLSVTIDGQAFSGLHIRPTVALCVYLICRPECHRREHLMALLWPDWPPASAHKNLRQNLYTLRQALPTVASRDGRDPVSLVLADRDTLQLNPEAAVDLDVDRFRALLRQNTPEAIAAAVALYRDDFLVDFYLPESAPFEEWSAALRGDLRRLMLEALDRVATDALEQSAYHEAVTFARRQLEMDNLRESAHRHVMRALALAGQRAEALAQYEACARLLRDELDIEPSAETRTLAERIAEDRLDPAGTVATLQPTWLTSANTPVPGHYLPQQLSSFIGRQKQLEDLVGLLSDPFVQLITVTGPGGIGKTRLAQEAARQSAANFRHGVYFIPLESARTSDEVMVRMMAGLGIRSNPSIPPDEAVLNLLQNKQALLVLDTLEHLPPEVDIISRIREFAPDVKILATSRSVLRLSGEHLFVVPPLADPGTATDPAEIARSDAVALFVTRAREVQPDFAVSAANATDVVETCRLLGGLPLALEMAAAHTRTLSLRQLRKQLSAGVDLLAGGPRDAPKRHQSIRETLTWSYDLLSPAEQALFRRFGIFAEGCTLTAAEAVAPEPTREHGYFVDLLTGLVDHSLVQIQTFNGRRIYRLHEISRHFAHEQLVASGELDETISKLLDYILGLAELVDQHFRDAGRNQWLGLFEPEDRHVRLVLDWGLTTDNPTTVTRCLALTGFMLNYWNVRGQHDLARHWAECALDRAHQLNLSVSARGPALITAASMAMIQADIQNSLRHAETALRLARETGDQRLEIRSHHLMGLCAFARAELDLAGELWGWALAQAEQLDEPLLLTMTLDDLGNLAARRGEYDQAIEFHLREQSVSLDAGDLYSEFYAVINLGEVSMLMERPADAELYYRRALKLCREMGDSRGLAQTLITQAALLVNLHRPAEARNLLSEAIGLAWSIQNLDVVLRALEMLIDPAVSDMSPNNRARLTGAVSHLSDLYSSASLPTNKESLMVLKEQLSREMDASTFALEWRIGRSHSWEQAVELGLEAIASGTGSMIASI